MESQNIFKDKINSGDISFPASKVELFSLLDRYVEISKINDTPEKLIEEFKESLIKIQKYKSEKDGGTYISRIKGVVKTSANKKLNDIVFAWYGVDLITYSIQRLIVDGKIKLVGKKIYLINQER